MNAKKKLKNTIVDCYRQFAGYDAPSELDVCTACCVELKIEEEMRTLPLSELTEKHFYQYNSSAKGDVQPVDEIKYYLPRMLELLAEGKEIHFATELYLDRLGRCSRQVFSYQEWKAIENFCVALFEHELTFYPWEDNQRIVGLIENVFDMLLMFDIGGLDIQPFLDIWTERDTPQATLIYIEAAYWEYWAKMSICNPFAEQRLDYQEIMNAWLLSKSHHQQFATRIQQLDFATIEGATAWRNGIVPIQDQIEHILNCMTL